MQKLNTGVNKWWKKIVFFVYVHAKKLNTGVNKWEKNYYYFWLRTCKRLNTGVNKWSKILINLLLKKYYYLFHFS